MDPVSWQGMVEFRTGRQLFGMGFPEGDLCPQLILALEDLFSHPFQLGSGEIPLVCDIVLVQIRIDRIEDPHLEAIVLHLHPVRLGHREVPAVR